MTSPGVPVIWVVFCIIIVLSALLMVVGSVLVMVDSMQVVLVIASLNQQNHVPQMGVDSVVAMVIVILV